MRKLASIQRISEKRPITRVTKNTQEEAENIALFKCGGMSWQFIAEKSLDVGDLVVFFEIDSVLPERDWSMFLAKTNFRVKTLKMWGVMSQGLALPVKKVLGNMYVHEGQDVTELLQVTQYEVPDTPGSRSTGTFPSYLVPKTDQLRLQSVFDKAMEELFANTDGIIVVTQKMDGSSWTAGLNGDSFIVCSRNFQLQKDDSSYWRIATKYNVEENLRKNNLQGYFLQGEMCGPGIQKNKIGLKELTLYVYAVYDSNTQRYLNHHELEKVCTLLELETVPVLHVLYVPSDVDIDFFLRLADGKYPNGATQEGIVFYPPNVTQSNLTHNGIMSYKVISPAFNLEHGE